MAEANSKADEKGRLRSLWDWFWLRRRLRSERCSSAVSWPASCSGADFNWAMELTNTESFCITCHEMKDNVFAEYRSTPHYSNRSGVRASCPDCHVPKEWRHKIVRKIQASNELYHHFLGDVSTPEQFAKKRIELAKHEWARMKSSDFTRMPQLPQVRLHGLHAAGAARVQDAPRGADGRQDLHRLPSWHRAQAAAERQRGIQEADRGHGGGQPQVAGAVSDGTSRAPSANAEPAKK